MALENIEKPRLGRALGITDFMAKKFDEFEFDGIWLQAMGKPEKNFKAIIFGKPQNGKTEFCIKFAKYLTNFGKVLYNSFEQGHSKSLQDAFVRQNMQDVKGKVIITHKERFEVMHRRLKLKKSPNIVFIDSVQHIKLTPEQWMQLTKDFPKKVFLVISHANGDEPKGSIAEFIQYDVDISILVKGFAAHCQGRFGGGDDIIIWPEGHERYLARMNKKPPSPKVGQKTNSPELPFAPRQTPEDSIIDDIVNEAL